MKCFFPQHLLALFCLLAMEGSLRGATVVWIGAGLDGSFSNSANWSTGAVPASNVDILQAGANTVGSVPFIGFNAGEFRTPSFTFLPGAVAPYTVTAASASDTLTLTGSGVALQNTSPVRQRFELITTTVAATAQTWDGGAQGLAMAQIDIGNNNVLTVTGTGTTAATRNEIKGGITGTMTSGLTKAGTGILLLDNPGLPSDYTGPTRIVSGRLQLGRANQIPNSSKLILNGGTFDTGGFSDTMGTLVLDGIATIDFGITDVVSLIFSDSKLELWGAGTLTILDFTLGEDSMRIGTDASALTAGQLAQINFDGVPAALTSTGFLVPIPEPAAATVLLSSLSVFGFHRRRRSCRATS
jgi:autotransporter-associated beta strand protein